MCKQVKALTKNCLLALSLILGLSVISPPVHAATFDFVGLVAAVGEQSWDNVPTSGAVGFDGPTDTWTQGGLEVVASSNVGVAYLDSLFSGRPAGLGICQVDPGAFECDPASDDNIEEGEELTLTFNESVTLTDLLFRDADHFLFGGKLIINTVTYTVVSGVLDAVTSGFSTTWIFKTFDIFGENNDEQFYVSSLVAAVPIPAAGILFGSALAGIGFLSRRRRKKQNRQAVTGLVSQG